MMCGRDAADDVVQETFLAVLRGTGEYDGWESPELNMLISSRFSDPRTGVVEYRLTNISRSEPRADLFSVPSDYTVIESNGGGRGGRAGGSGDPAQPGQGGRQGRTGGEAIRNVGADLKVGPYRSAPTRADRPRREPAGLGRRPSRYVRAPSLLSLPALRVCPPTQEGEDQCHQ